jgi:mannose/fructose-specific phosphotransferase system component IIA
MSDGPRIRGIVVGHGDMPTGLVDAVRHIAGGAAEDLVALSNEGKSPQQLADALSEAAGDVPSIVFADLRAGSCGTAAAYCCRDQETRAIVCGVNLPMLLDFVFHRDLPLNELVERLVEKGRDAIHSAPLGAS